jgi:hypothetical protein
MKTLFHYIGLSVGIWISAILIAMLPAGFIFALLNEPSGDMLGQILGFSVIAAAYSAIFSIFVPPMLLIVFYALRELKGSPRKKMRLAIVFGVVLCAAAMAIFGTGIGGQELALIYFPLYAIAASLSIWFWMRKFPLY